MDPPRRATRPGLRGHAAAAVARRHVDLRRVSSALCRVARTSPTHHPPVARSTTDRARPDPEALPWPPHSRRHPGQAQARRGPVEARLPRAAEPQRADQEGRRRAQRAGPDRERLRPSAASTRSTRPTCAAGCAGGGSTPSAGPGSTAAAPRALEPEELDDSLLHAAGAHRRRRADHRAAAAARRDLPRLTPATPPTSPTGRTSSTTGSEIEDMPAIWQQAGGRRPAHHRGLRGHPAGHPRLAGRRHRRRRDDRPAAGHRRDPATATSAATEFSNLPRKFKSAISWQQDVAHEVNDVSFIGVEHPEHGPGFDVWVGGGLSTNPKIAQRLGAWVPLDEVPDVWAGVIVDLPRLRLPHGCGTGPGSSSWSPTGARPSSAGCWSRSTCTAR